MGIPHLVHSLQPYAIGGSQHRGTHVEWLRRENAIIDGPALAYHAYARAVARRNFARNALEAMPSYLEVNLIVVECLEVLELHAFSLCAIFFDGFLPPGKREVRQSRLASYLRQMETFRIQYSTGVDVRSDNNDFSPPGAEDSFSNIHLSAKSRNLPALPFLVPSVIEALSQSRFAEYTKVVPAEADTYCASYTKEHGGTIVTSDSDLLAYDLGPDGSVLLFKDIELEGNTPDTKLKISRYETTRIAQRLGLKTLQPLAFAIRDDHYSGFAQCLTQARQLEKDGEAKDYKAFLLEYALPDIHKQAWVENIEPILQRLDPRISEWIHQVLTESDLASAQPFDMFLPFLIEDTTRVSAWNMGAGIRQLVYSMLKPSTKQKRLTTEFSRRGIRIADKQVEHLSEPAIESSLMALNHALERVMESCEGMLVWRLVGLYTMCQAFLEEGKLQLPTRGNLRSLLAGNTIGKDWGFIHLSAQFQGALYSWRMLKQVISVLTVLPNAHFEVVASAKATTRLYKSLAHVPQIQDLFNAKHKVSDEELEAYIDTLYRILDVQEAPSYQQEQVLAETSSSTKKKRKKEKASKTRSNAGSSTPFSSSNIFDLLPNSA